MSLPFLSLRNTLFWVMFWHKQSAKGDVLDTLTDTCAVCGALSQAGTDMIDQVTDCHRQLDISACTAANKSVEDAGWHKIITCPVAVPRRRLLS